MNKSLIDIIISEKSRVMHIDTSSKLYEKKNTGIAGKVTKTNFHIGLALSSRLKKDLVKHLGANKDYARLYAICIYYLIRNNLSRLDMLVICGDEDFRKVKVYLEILFRGIPQYHKDYVISISYLRTLTGQRIDSYADCIAYSYRKRGLGSLAIQQRGTPLNLVKVTFGMIKDKWAEIERKMRK